MAAASCSVAWSSAVTAAFRRAASPVSKAARVSAAAASIFFAYVGFDAVSTAAEETKNPQRNMPIGLIGSLVICTIFYLLVGAGAIGSYGAQPLLDALVRQIVTPCGSLGIFETFSVASALLAADAADAVPTSGRAQQDGEVAGSGGLAQDQAVDGQVSFDINQGNMLSQDMVDRLKVGQTRVQVRAVLGPGHDPFAEALGLLVADLHRARLARQPQFPAHHTPARAAPAPL
mgnify:CR=1 FL=1